MRGRGERATSRGFASSGVMADRPPYPVTPDGRYFVLRGRLWPAPTLGWTGLNERLSCGI